MEKTSKKKIILAVILIATQQLFGAEQSLEQEAALALLLLRNQKPINEQLKPLDIQSKKVNKRKAEHQAHSKDNDSDVTSNEKPKIFLCKVPNCPQTFLHEFSMNDHFLRNHRDIVGNSANIVFKCPYCSFQLVNNERVLKMHIYKHPEYYKNRRVIESIQ